MAQEKRFYRKHNRHSGENQEVKKEPFAGGDGQQAGSPADGKKQKQGPKTSGSRNRNEKSYNHFNKKTGKPFHKFNGKPDTKDTGVRGNRPVGGNREKRKGKATERVLVAFYSWSGVTAKAAQRIASAAKGNSYRILPVKAYSSIYALCVAKGGMEKASGARPEIKGTLPDCSRYDKIAIGFPIWWFSCPMIIHSFLEKVKLDGKTVYPFCTSKTSGPKGSAADIRKTIPDAVVKECLDANKIDAMSDEEIKAWLEL